MNLFRKERINCVIHASRRRRPFFRYCMRITRGLSALAIQQHVCRVNREVPGLSSITNSIFIPGIEQSASLFTLQIFVHIASSFIFPVIIMHFLKYRTYLLIGYKMDLYHFQVINLLKYTCHKFNLRQISPRSLLDALSLYVRGRPYMMSENFSGFCPPPCPHLGLIYSTKFTQPPLLHLLLG